MAQTGEKKTRYSARMLAYDAIFCSVIVVFSLLFSSLAYVSRSVFGIVIASMIGFYFQNKTVVRSLTACAAMFLLLFILQGLVLALCVFLPNLLSGLIVSFALRTEKLRYFLISIPLLTLVAAGEYLLVSKLMLGGEVFDRVKETISQFDYFTIPAGKETLYYVGCIGAFCVGVGVLKSMICQKFHNIVTKHFPKLCELP